MRARYEFSFHTMPEDAATGHADPTLALMGSFGWEIRGIARASGGGYVVALQRPLDEELPIPDSLTLAASLEEPLAMPTSAEFEGR